MLIKFIFILNLHCPLIIEGVDPLNSFGPQFLKVGMGLEGCVSLN